jgi:hypothetical protein
MGEMAADEKAAGWAAELETGTELPGDGVQERGDRATVVDSYRVTRRPPPQQRPDGAGTVWYDGSPHQWRAEVRRDGGGWRLWSVVLPGWCGTYSRCAAPAATPSVSARIEPHLLPVQLPLQNRDLVAEGEDFRVLGLVADRQQPQHRERVRHTQLRES